MANSFERKSRLIRTLLSKTKSGAVSWKPRSVAGSYRAKVGDYEIHLDYNRSADSEYEIWVLDNATNIIDSIGRFDLNGSLSDLKENVIELYSIAESQDVNEQIDELNSILDNL